jgi:hypothetical protein
MLAAGPDPARRLGLARPGRWRAAAFKLARSYRP